MKDLTKPQGPMVESMCQGGFLNESEAEAYDFLEKRERLSNGRPLAMRG